MQKQNKVRTKSKEIHLDISLHWECLQWWQSLFSSESAAAPHHHTAPSKDVSLSVPQSEKRAPRLLHTLTLRSKCCRQNLDSSLNITFLHMVRLPTPAQTGLRMKGSHGRPPDSPMRPEIGCVHSVPDCLRREPSDILSCKPWLQIYRSLSTVPKCWQDKERVFLGCRLLGTATSQSVSDIPHYMELGLQ